MYIESKICKGSIVEADTRNAMVRGRAHAHAQCHYWKLPCGRLLRGSTAGPATARMPVPSPNLPQVRQNVNEHDISEWLRNADILRSKKAERLQVILNPLKQARLPR